MAVVRIQEPIYQVLQEYAKQENRTVSNAANHLLAGALTGTPAQNTPLPKKTDLSEPVKDNYPQKNASEATPRVDDIIRDFKPTAEKVAATIPVEQPCCANEIVPCKHWKWDEASGEGYKNTLSGRFMEVEG